MTGWLVDRLSRCIRLTNEATRANREKPPVSMVFLLLLLLRVVDGGSVADWSTSTSRVANERVESSLRLYPHVLALPALLAYLLSIVSGCVWVSRCGAVRCGDETELATKSSECVEEEYMYVYPAISFLVSFFQYDKSCAAVHSHNTPNH